MPPEETDVETVSRDMEVASQVSHTPSHNFNSGALLIIVHKCHNYTICNFY